MLGEFEYVLITTAAGLGENAYGVAIREEIEAVLKRKCSIGALYTTMDRLEDKGLISSWLSDPTAERGGRAKRCYTLEALGERALQESAATARRIWDVIAEVWGKDWARERGKRWGREAR